MFKIHVFQFRVKLKKTDSWLSSITRVSNIVFICSGVVSIFTTVRACVYKHSLPTWINTALNAVNLPSFYFFLLFCLRYWSAPWQCLPRTEREGIRKRTLINYIMKWTRTQYFQTGKIYVAQVKCLHSLLFYCAVKWYLYVDIYFKWCCKKYY